MRHHVSVCLAAETWLRFSNHLTVTKNDNLAERIILSAQFDGTDLRLKTK